MDTHSRRNSIHTSHARRIVRASPSQAISSRQGLALLATIAPNASPHAWPLDRPFDVVANTERIPCYVASPACSRSAAFRVVPLSAAVSAGHVRVPLRDMSECRDRVSGYGDSGAVTVFAKVQRPMRRPLRLRALPGTGLAWYMFLLPRATCPESCRDNTHEVSCDMSILLLG